MNWLWLVGLASLLGPAQDQELGRLAVTVRLGFEARDFARLFDERQPVRLELPSQPAAVSVRGEIAAAALGSMVRRTADIQVITLGSAVVAPGHGYVELRRRFRVLGTQEEQGQKILISARFDEGRWRITEVWVTPARS